MTPKVLTNTEVVDGTTRIYRDAVDDADFAGKTLFKIDVADGLQIKVSLERLKRNMDLARTRRDRMGVDENGEYIDVPLTWLIGERVGY